MGQGKGGGNVGMGWASNFLYKFKNHFKIIKPGQHTFIYKCKGIEKTTQQYVKRDPHSFSA